GLQFKADLFLSEGRGGRKLLSASQVHGGRTAYVSHGTFDQAYRLFARPDLLRRVSRFHPRAIAQAFLARRDFRRDRNDMHGAKWVVAVSPFVAESVRSTYGVAADRVRIIGNGVTVPARLPSQATARKRVGMGQGTWLLFLGRLEPVKGVLDLVKAVQSQPDLNLLVAGTGPEERTLSAIAQTDPGLRERVRFLGRVSDEKKWDCYVASDFFVLPSKSEGEPISILEALGVGRPVVTTQDWVAPGLRDGCVIDPDVGDGIRTALDSKLRIEKIARRVREEHTWESVAEHYLSLGEAPTSGR
ncbi:MAG TPA: glycosyltransferase family 4 protein, partial [Candidatus Thermoplasmatota archaeon]